MFAHHRLEDIFHYIHTNEYTSATRLAKHLHVTERTIRNDIAEINASLSNCGAVINLKRKYGYYVEITDPDAFHTFLSTLAEEPSDMLDLDSSKDRIRFILNVLLHQDDYVALEDIMEQVCISKNTLNNYIKSIKQLIAPYDLEYIAKASSGIRLIGSEDAKRKCIIDHVLSSNFETYITGFTKEEKRIFAEVDLDYIRELTLTMVHDHFSSTSDFNSKNLMIHLALMVQRVQEGHYITMDDVPMDEGVYEIVQELSHNMEDHFDITLSKGEKSYLYLHLIANTNTIIEDIEDDTLQQQIEQMLTVIYESYYFDLREDNVLKGDLFRHLKSVFVGKTYALNNRNPLLDTIKKNYPLAFEISFIASSQVFAQEPFVLTEADVGYISLHIGAAIERYFARSNEKKKVILICGSGLATTRMLETRLSLYFPDKITISRSVSYLTFTKMTEEELQDVDFAISTIAVQSNQIPVITVNFALHNEDIEAISKHLSQTDSIQLRRIEHFFDPSLFFHFDHYDSKEELIKTLYDALNEQGIVTEDFLPSVLKRETLGQTNMNEIFAMPHPMELCASETKVAVAILKKPLAWNDSDNIQIVFLLAIKQGVQKDMEHLYDVFINIVNDTKLQQRILKAESFFQFMQALSDYK